MKQVEGKRRSARWPKNTSSGTRPGTATMLQPVAAPKHVVEAAEIGNAVGGDAKPRDAVEKLAAGAAAQNLFLAMEQGAPDRVLGRRHSRSSSAGSRARRP